MIEIRLPFILALSLALTCLSCSQKGALQLPMAGKGVTVVDEYTLRTGRHYLTDFLPLNTDNTINAVIEIPAGTTAKWEVEQTSGDLRWKSKKGNPRIVKYLAYPANYGMIPQTKLPKELGGDGDPLDVVLLGKALPRGAVIKARILGMLKLIDKGEIDDKIIAIAIDDPMNEISSLSELDQEYPGISRIIEIWFSNYKGPGKMKSLGFGDEKQAQQLLQASMKAYKQYPD